MKNQVSAAIKVLLFFTLLLGIIYPVSVTLIGNAAFADKAQGSLIKRDGKVVGSKLIGQKYDGLEWFQSRPSNAGEGYDAASSGGSNLGPTNPDLLALVKDRVKQYRTDNNLSDDVQVPIDAVTASGSGLDNGISIANACIQAKRISKSQDIPISTLNKLIEDNTFHKIFGFIGEDYVNIVTLNRDLSLIE